MRNLEQVSADVVDVGFQIHRDLGPGLLETVYEVVFEAKLRKLGLDVRRQVPVNIAFDGLSISNAFRADLVVADCLVVEIKSVETLLPVHAKQLQTYLRLMDLRLGLLVNFGAATFKEGVCRLVNGHTDFASSRLRAN